MLDLDVLLLEGASAAAVGTTIDVFDAANRVLGSKRFRLRFVGASRSVRIRGGLVAQTTSFRTARPRPVVVIPGFGMATEAEIAERLDCADVQAARRWLIRAAAKSAQVAASCTAVFLLGEAGLLDRRRCVTTWWLGGTLGSRYPACEVDVDRMVVRDGSIWTAGSAFAHVDLMLALLGAHAPPGVCEEVAKRLVFDPRPSQASFLIPTHLATSDPAISRLDAIVRRRIDAAHPVEELAAHLHVSPRTLARRTKAALGLSPSQYVRKVRLEHAIHLLRTTRAPLDQVAAKVGFESATTLYRLIKQATGAPPGVVRNTGRHAVS